MGSPEQRVVHSSVDPNWRTPDPLFDKLNDEAHFVVDLAATREDCKVHDCGVPYYLGPDHPAEEFRNALRVNWANVFGAGPGFLNMPYSVKKYRETKDPAYQIQSWVKKCFDEAEAGFTTWALIPFAPQARWYRNYIMGHGGKTGTGFRGFCALEVRRLPYRVTFDPSPEYAAHMLNELAAGRRKSGTVGSAGHNVVVVKFGPNPGYVGPWGPVERYWSYR